VLKYGYSVNTGDRRLNMVAVSSSGPDERGSYRIYGLAPGEYYVSAVNANAAMPGGLDLHLTSDVDVQDALKPGASGTGTAMPEVPQPNVGYGQVFYPGAASVAQATPIAVRAGEERPGVDFTIHYSPAARVEGTLLSPAGGPSAGHLHLTGYDSSGNMVAIGDTPRTQAGADGRFSFADVPPGPYVLSAHEVVSGSAGERPQIAYAMTDLDVRSELVSGLSLTLQDAFTVSGTIRYDGDGPPPDFRDLRVILTRAQIDGSVTVATGRPTTTADGRFTVDGVAPGRYLLRVNQPPLSRLALRSATILGQDAADAGADVRQTVTDSVITMTDRVSELTGRIESPAGAAAADYAMLLFSSDRAHWRSQSRRILAMRLANDGSFAFRNVPPGDYLLAAVDDVEPGEWFDPAFLQRLAPAAIRVTIGDGEKKVQDVRLGGR
jgi:hypothetical protein